MRSPQLPRLGAQAELALADAGVGLLRHNVSASKARLEQLLFGDSVKLVTVSLWPVAVSQSTPLLSAPVESRRLDAWKRQAAAPKE